MQGSWLVKEENKLPMQLNSVETIAGHSLPALIYLMN
jgi:hypothetical protein